MKIFRFVLGLFLVSLGIGNTLAAESGAIISYAEGNGFILVSEGERNQFDLASDYVIGMPIQQGDTILTDDKTFLEIKIEDGNGGVVKLAENTTFTVTAIDGRGGGFFKLTYGRIRVKLAKLFAGSRFRIIGGDTLAAVRGTDFGYDLFFDDKTNRKKNNFDYQTYIYSFEGEVAVEQSRDDILDSFDEFAEDTFTLHSNEMVITDPSTLGIKLIPIPISDDIVNYWNRYPIVTPIKSDTPIAEVAALASEPEPLPPVLTEPGKNDPNASESLDFSYDSEGFRLIGFRSRAQIAFIAGVATSVAGSILKFISPYDSTIAYISSGLMISGGIVTAVSSGMLISVGNIP